MPAFAGMTHLQGYGVGTLISATAEIYGLGFSKPFVKRPGYPLSWVWRTFAV